MRNLLTTAPVARILEKSEATVRKMADDGRLQVAETLDDRTRLFDRRVIEEYKNKQTTSGHGV